MDAKRMRNIRGLAMAVVLGLAVVACGDDGDTSAPTGDPTSSAPSDDGSGIEGSVSDGDLVVPRDYLQGEWCDSDGGSWTIEGDTATLDDGSGGVGEFPVDLLFIKGVDVELFSQTDDAFVFGSSGDTITFTRGSC